MQKSIEKTMHLGIDFWKDFGGFLDRKWWHVGTKINEKSMQNANRDFLKNRALAAAGAWFLRFWGSRLGANTIKKQSKNGVKMGRHLGIDF